MLESKSNQSGHTITETFTGSKFEVMKAMQSFLSQYCNGGYSGYVESVTSKGLIFTAVCVRDSNCD